MKIMIRIITAAFILIFALSFEAQAKLYTWTDEKGVAHISNQPPGQEEIQTPPPKKKIERHSVKETLNNTAENWLKIPGTKISMNPPPGFIAADHFPGFFHPEIEVLDIKEITIDNLPGYEITARGTVKNHGGACFAYQVILYGETDYYLIVGIVSADEKADYLPAFQQIAMTFKRN